MSKDQDLFKKACQKILGGQYESVKVEAIEAYNKALSTEPCKLKKQNEALRAANLVMLEAIKGYGISNWRQFMEENVKSGFDRIQREPMQQPIQQPMPNKPREKKWNGPSILDMADQNRGKRK